MHLAKKVFTVLGHKKSNLFFYNGALQDFSEKNHKIVINCIVVLAINEILAFIIWI